MYKIEITAETLAELAGKAASLAAKLNTGAGTERATGWSPIKEAADIELEVAEAAPSPEPVTAAAETASSQNTTATAQPEPSESSETAKNTDASSASSGSAELDFDTDVAPYVLQVVKEKGKPVAQEILSQFGVERASLLDPAHWPELVAQLKGVL